VPQDWIPDDVDPDTIEEFSIEYDDSELEDAITVEDRKHFREELGDEVVPAQSNKRNRSG
jgi:hypothetical protein